MKSTCILPLLAFAIVPALSQPRNAAGDSMLEPTIVPRDVGLLCSEAGALISNQLDEITKLQAKNLPVPSDLAGYFYEILYGRKLLGCPSTPILGTNLKRSDIIDDHPEVKGDPCKTLQVQLEQISEVIDALKGGNIPIPPFMAGRWSLVADAEKSLQCGLDISTVTTSDNSTDPSTASD